jgi:APA family basic amino acid/polyamine antiporter
MSQALDRRLGLIGSTAVGVAAMLGAGLFVVLGPAAASAGDGLLTALAAAAVVAACNALSSARLAALHPVSGGTYVYGRERLGPFWGHLAGWSFVTGKLASCGAMALAIGSYARPEHARVVAVAAILAVTAVNLAGVEKSARASIVIVSAVLAVTLAAIGVMAAAPPAESRPVGAGPGGVLEAAGLLFFAFAGYARLATLGEEVRDPVRTIPRAIALSFVAVVTVYAAAALALVHVLGLHGLSTATRPFVAGLDAAGAHPMAPVVVAAATLAAGGAVLSLTLGVSRTILAMARDRHLPHVLATVGPRRRVPWAAELAVMVVVIGLVLVADLARSIAFSSFCVLVYYAVTNVAALTLPAGRFTRATAVVGLAGCSVLAIALPPAAAATGAGVVVAGALSYAVRRR